MINLAQTELPFGFQKPRGWWRHYQPLVVDGAQSGLADRLSNMKPLRLEIPVRLAEQGYLCESLRLPEQISMKFIPAHADYLTGAGEPAAGWGVVQLLSPIAANNKGTALRNFLATQNAKARVIHFGDSSTDHNSDTLVGEVIPNSTYVEIRWENGREATEALLVQAIKSYL
jgi:hypothetical protein